MTRPIKARAWSSLLCIALTLPFTGCAAVPAAGGVAGPAGAATGFTGILGQLCQNLEACKAKFCASPCGQLFSQGMAPLKCLTGGAFGNCCPTTPTAAQQAQPGAAGAAAQIQADTAAAKARVAAVEYLGTVDCHYWPEAEKTLIDSLRADRNECVRFAAARVMGTGCCCTNKTIAALTLTASGDDSDGNPSENSLRVRIAAAAALSRCAMNPPEPIKPRPPERPEPVQPELPPAISLERIDPSLSRSEFFYQTAERTPRDTLVARARQAIAHASNESQAAESATGMPPVGSQSLFDIVSHAQAPKPSATPVAPAEKPEAPNFAQVPKSPAPPTTPAVPRTAARSNAVPKLADAPARADASDQPPTARTLKDLFIQSTGAR